MRYEHCRCARPTKTKLERWQPFPDAPTAYTIERCAGCGKIKDMRLEPQAKREAERG